MEPITVIDLATNFDRDSIGTQHQASQERVKRYTPLATVMATVMVF